MVRCEICEREIISLNVHKFPEDLREEETYCVCIPWETMKQCTELCLANAQRLIEDSDFLLKAKRLSSANILAILSLEESGKALLACEYLAKKKKVSKGDYQNRFLDHSTKMRKALEAAETAIPQLKMGIEILGLFTTNKLLKEKLQGMFVDYDGRFQTWNIPWSQDPEPLVKTCEALMRAGVMDLKRARRLRKAQEQIHEGWIEGVLIRIARTAMDCARQRFATVVSVGDKGKVSS
jgi:AbiV family abortive infection protein